MAELSKERRKLLLRRKKKLKDGGSKEFIFIKPNETIRFRALPVPEDEEFGREIIQFYLGPEIKGVISPKTVGEQCAIYDKYEELKNSEDEDDQALAEKLKPKTKYVVPCIRMKDKLGKVIDKQMGKRMIMLAKKPYQQMVDLFLEPEQGDFTDPRQGYDLKLTRTGAGMTDTEYSILPCKTTVLPKEYRETMNLEEMLRKAIPSYKGTQQILARFMGIDADDDERPKKKKKLVKKHSKYER